MALCKDWATQADTFAGAKGRYKDWVQALCTLAVETLHGTCCFDLSEEAVRSRVLVWENLRVVLWSVCSRVSPGSLVRSREAQAS